MSRECLIELKALPLSVFSVTIKTGELPSDVKKRIIPTESSKSLNASSSVITVRRGYLLMRDSRLVIASKYNSCSSSSFIFQKAVCFHKLEGKFWFQKSVIEVVFFVFNRILDHKRVHIPNIGSLAHS